MNAVKLELSLDEANLVLEALGNLPFVRVYELIGKIQKQAQAGANASSGDGDDSAADPA